MRAATITRWRDDLAIKDVPRPVCPTDGVVVRVVACGVCRSDWHAWCGHDPDVSPGQIPGHEYCGVVDQVGSQAPRWRPGDRVIAPFILACGACEDCAAGHQTTCAHQVLPGFNAPGAFAEYLAVPHAETNLVRLPEGMDEALAAALGCRATTAWHALTDRAALRGGEWLAIFGAGGIGLASLLLGKALGARVLVVDVVAQRLDYAREQGADVALDGNDPALIDAIHEHTGGGAHVAIEALGIEATTCNALRCLRKLGRHVQIGMPAGEHATMRLPMDVVYRGQLALYGTRGMPAWRYPSLLSMIDGGRVNLAPMIARRVPLSAVNDELRAFDDPGPPGVAVIVDFQN